VSPRVGQENHRKSRPPPGLDSGSVQLLASRYTDYAVLAHELIPVQATRHRGGLPWQYMEMTGQIHAPAVLTPRERSSVSMKQRTGWIPEPVWACRRKEKSVIVTRTRPSDRPARSVVTITTTILRTLYRILTPFKTELRILTYSLVNQIL
jgi:hypothetical protein